MDSCTQQTDGESSAQSQEELVPHSPPAPEPLATRHSPLASSPLATRYSPLATRYSPLATRHSPLAQALAEHTLLSLRVLDPACGSGHFLLAAARRLGKELAKIRTGKDEPDPDHVREAIRDVVARCLYGVDKNPLAVELCRVALWLEAHCTNKPLTFLDHHIKCGDSLVGVRDLAVLEKGIPDEAFVAVSADDKATASQLKKRNKKERHTLETRQGQLPFDPTDMLAGLREQRQQLEAIADDSPADVRRKKSLYDDYDRDPQRRKLAEACHLWTAAFFQRLKPGAAPSAITTQVITDHLADRRHPQAVAIAEALAAEQRFFHWPLEFPEVFGGMASSEWRVASGGEASGSEASGEWRVASGGEASGEWRVASSNSPLATRDSLLAAFDVVLSNPPWERIKLQEEEFFAGRDARIAQAPNAAARKRLIAGLPVTNPDLWDAYQRALHRAESASRFLRGSRQYPLTGCGDINTYSVFAERIRCLLSSAGRAGIILPTGIATDDTNKSFFADLVEKGHLVSLFDFENREAIFPAVHRSYKFCLLTLTGGSEEVGSEQGASSERRVASSEQGASSEQRVASEASSEQRVASSDQPLATRHSPLAPSATFAFFATRAEHLRDPRRVFSLTAADIARINPNTRTLPVFRTRQDADLTRTIYERVPLLVNKCVAKGEVANPWGVRFLAMFHMSNDSHLFRTRDELQAEDYRLRGNVFAKEENGQTSRYLPLYEAKMVWQYDHRYGTYEGVSSRSGTQLPTPGDAQHADPQFVVQPWYWVPAEEVAARLGDWQRGWLLGFRDVTNATNERTAIFSLLPRVGVGNKLPILLCQESNHVLVCCLLCNLNTQVFDYVTRQKIAGVNMNFFLVSQLPVLPPAAYTPEDLRFIVPRVLELTYTAWDMQPFADDVWQEADEALRAAIRTQWEANRREANGEWRVASSEQGASSEQRVASSEQGASSEQRVASSEQGASSEQRVASSDQPLATRHSPLAPSATRHSPLAPSATRHSPLASEPLAPFIWNAARRAQIRAELDAYYARLYGLTRKQLRYILDPADLTERELEDILDPWEERGADSEVASSEQPLATRHSPLAPEPLATRHSPLAPSATRHSPTSHSPSAHTFPGETFRVLKEKEIRQFGEYRTRRLVLEAWARLTGSGNG
ncbi:Eco57I restriction-modification methylase domain-containing protein [Chloracidobacterium aggregatum]|uniref:Eco57I restriction-modification methylase domain-containing protein n=1 Tax=Chloracidobacterium aggregatum TaxID=2851959 RepID=UPI003211C1B5